MTNQDLILIKTDPSYSDRIPAISYATQKNFNTAIAEDRDGRLWLSGLYSISVLETDASINYNFITEKDYYSLRQKSITSLLIDDDGFLWMGLENQGLNRIKIESPLHSIKESFGVSGLSNLPVEDKWGNLWFYTAYTGLHCLKKSNDGNPLELLRYKRSIFNDMHWPMNMIIDRDNAIWMANRRALYKVKLFNNGDSIAVTQIQAVNESVLKQPHFVQEDKAGNIWITENTLSLANKNLNSSGGGLYKLDNNKLYKYGKAQGLLADDTYTICEDNDGSIWLNSLYKGLTRFEPAYKENPLGRWTHFNTENDFQKRPYAITKHPKKGVFIHVNPKTLFVESSESPDILNVQSWSKNVLNENYTEEKRIVTNTISRSDNEYWFGYHKGIARAELNSNVSSENKPTIEHYSLLDGFPDSDLRYLKEDQNGIIWAIGKNDVIGINPQVMDRSSLQPVAQLNSLKQGDQYYSIPNELDLTFNYQENYIDFEYHAIDVNRNHQLEYRYQLDGYETNWNAPTKFTNTSYPNLPHGSYTFKVESRISNGAWGTTASYDFKIRPPWWKSKLAYILYSGLTLLFIAWTWRDLLNRIRIKNQIEKELLEAEKIREIDEVKTRFFTNMSHEYRTPLTVILGMTEELEEDSLAKKLIKQSGRNLLRLVNQMLDFNKLEDGNLSLNLEIGEFVSYLQY
ncbi:MAG: histidine kinase dimerization/phospho-acceptor domain-containing protein, partial [Bacteroidota bacterium]